MSGRVFVHVSRSSDLIQIIAIAIQALRSPGRTTFRVTTELCQRKSLIRVPTLVDIA